MIRTRMCRGTVHFKMNMFLLSFSCRSQKMRMHQPALWISDEMIENSVLHMVGIMTTIYAGVLPSMRIFLWVFSIHFNIETRLAWFTDYNNSRLVILNSQCQMYFQLRVCNDKMTNPVLYYLYDKNNSMLSSIYLLILRSCSLNTVFNIRLWTR